MASFWDFVPALITAGAALYGADKSSAATNKATQQLTTAQNNATAAQVAGLGTATQTLDANRTAASPGLLAEQALISRGSALTPEQEQAVTDSRDTAINDLRGGSLRGSARATSAVISDTDNRVRNNFMTTNQTAANGAAANLSGQYFGAGNNLATTATNTGNAISTGLTNTGDVNAANTVGQASIQGKAIGDVGAIIADQLKQQARPSSYSTTTPPPPTKPSIYWNDGSVSY